MMPTLTYLYWRYVRPLRDEKGATAVEYGIMVALIAAVIILAVTAIGTNLSGLFTRVSGSIK